MQKRTIFLLQDTKENVDKLATAFAEEQGFEVIGWSTDGISGISMIAEKKPQYIITDLVLSGYDGLCVIERIRSQNAQVKIVVLSALCREEIIAKSISYGANYFMAKPFDFNILKERLLQLDEKVPSQTSAISGVRRVSLEEKISKIFINVGIPPHIKGYSFLREGVLMAVENPSIINNITKQLYPMIGKKYDTTASKVERAIRHAIEVAWNRGRIESINSILGVRAYVGAEKPTNGEFIALVADKMLLEKA